MPRDAERRNVLIKDLSARRPGLRPEALLQKTIKGEEKP